MTAQIKTTLGEVHALLEKAVDYYCQQMKHGSVYETVGSFYKRREVKHPMEKEDYWPLMMQAHPWKEIAGFYNAALTFPADREMWISVELAGQLGIGVRGLEK